MQMSAALHGHWRSTRSQAIELAKRVNLAFGRCPACDRMALSFPLGEVLMKTALNGWDSQWSTPSTRIEQLAPLFALALALLVSWF
jgi:hypothetical protein